ncbi:hypothetical protein [Hydrocarboniphaga sp.]|uniref:hypothetical protein n=1 Tax=Hydrocarboniphaga sp. TaxID=2033016 RepID=UPI003D14AB48
MKTRIVTPALFGAAALLCAATSYATATPVDTASVTNANPALPRPKADPTTTAEAVAASAGPAEDIGADADSPPPGSSGAAQPGAATASEDIGADANSPPPGSSSAPKQTAAAEPPPAAPAPASSGEPATEAVASQDDFRAAVKPKAPWWGPSVSNDRFGVKYVAQAADQPALLIRFSRDVSRDAATQNIKLSKNGKPVETAWQQGSDPRTLIAPNLKPGRYTVVIESQLASAAGESLGTQLKGKTRIR